MNKAIWKAFELGDAFKIETTKSGIDKNKILEEIGNVPYITRTDLNNGIGGFIGEEQLDIYEKNDGNVITIGLDTQTVHYQPNSFYTGQNIQILKHKRLNERNAKYLIPLIKKLMTKFNWGSNGATLTRLKRSKILLPTKSDQSIDWEYMEQYIENQKSESIEKVIRFLKVELENIGDFKKTVLEEIEWREFKVEELFSSKIGKSINGNQLNLENGSIPYVTRKTTNNGIDGFIDFKDEKYLSVNDRYVITIGNETAKPFVQRGSFYTGTKVNILTPYVKCSEYTLHFINGALDRATEKFSYSFTINSTRLKKLKFILPSTSVGDPDYDFMENYIKGLKYERIKVLLKQLKDN